MDNWGKLGSSLIFYFVAVDDREIHYPWQMQAETYTRLGHSAPASNNLKGRIPLLFYCVKHFTVSDNLKLI
jgi:hypothetical protein